MECLGACPEEVYTQEWQMHADYWRFSLDVNHRSPEGNGRNPQYFKGTPFNPEIAAICNKLQELKNRLGDRPFLGLPIIEDIEKKVIKDRISSFKIDPAIKDDKVKNFIKSKLLAEKGEDTANQLLLALKMEIPFL